MGILTNPTMPKECTTTAIIGVEETKNLGSANTKNYMQPDCAKIATSTTTTERKGSSWARMKLQKIFPKP